MSTDFDGNTDDAFGAQDSDKRILLRWGAIVAAIVVMTCLVTTSLLKVLGLISAPWLWVAVAAGISSIVTGLVVLLFVAVLAATFVNAIRGIG